MSILHLGFNLLLALVLALTSGCVNRPLSNSYRDFYSHLSLPHKVTEMHETKHFIVFLVEARHLDYTDNVTFFQTLAKHPSDGSKNGDVGHAWIYLQGEMDGECVVIEGGHSGELGIVQPKYVEGVVRYWEHGDANPVRYLWAAQKDGFFQEGAGGHIPTFAAKVDLTPEQFNRILSLIFSYPFHEYSLTSRQCSSFLALVAEEAGLHLEHETTMNIAPELYLGGERLVFWRDPCYASISFSTPDLLEKSLMEAVRAGEAEYALTWYLKRNRRSLSERATQAWRTGCQAPRRFLRLWTLD